jgi:hypothetical protein
MGLDAEAIEVISDHEIGIAAGHRTRWHARHRRRRQRNSGQCPVCRDSVCQSSAVTALRNGHLTGTIHEPLASPVSNST